jgi:hypothetical protein
MGEADVVVVDDLVGRPELLALLEQHVALVVLPWGRRLDMRPLPHIILRPRRGRKLSQECQRWESRRRWWGRRPLTLWRVPRLDEASWLFFVFFSQDGIFTALALWVEIAVVCARVAPAHASL